MTLESRLQDLLAERNHEQAVTLAKAAMTNEAVVDVVVDDRRVVVETPRFRGVHRWWTDPEGRVRLDERGSYDCTCDGVDLPFSTMRMHPVAHDRAMERLRERTAADSGAGAAGTEAGTVGTETGTAGTGVETAGTGRSDASREETAGPGESGPSATAPDARTPLADGGTADGGERSRASWWSRIFRRIAVRFP